MDKTVPSGAARLLDFIGSIEAPHGYDTVYGNNQRKLPKPLTSMMIDEVLAAQSEWTKRFGSSACGRYQFMKATLQGLKNELGLRGTQILDANLQDRLGYHLLKRRGYERFATGAMSATAFGLELAKEWASFPALTSTTGAHRAVKRGQSYYAGDGQNKALVTPERVEVVLAASRKASAQVADAGGRANTFMSTTTEKPMFSLPDIILGAVRGAVAEAVPQVVGPQVSARIEQARATPVDEPLPPSAQPVVDTAAVITAVTDKLSADPRFQAATQETASIPWYRSPVTVGSMVALAAPLVGLLGWNMTAADQANVVIVVTALGGASGGLVALISRLRSRIQPVTATAKT